MKAGDGGINGTHPATPRARFRYLGTRAEQGREVWLNMLSENRIEAWMPTDNLPAVLLFHGFLRNPLVVLDGNMKSRPIGRVLKLCTLTRDLLQDVNSVRMTVVGSRQIGVAFELCGAKHNPIMPSLWRALPHLQPGRNRVTPVIVPSASRPGAGHVVAVSLNVAAR